MHIDWSCFALIVMEGGTASGSGILCYRNMEDSVARGMWRLPGGPKSPADTDVINTLTRCIRKQTGINLIGKNHIPCLEVKNHLAPRPRHARRTKRYTVSERYYRVTATPSEYIDRVGFDSSESVQLEWMSSDEIIYRNSKFYEPHRLIVQTYAKN